MVKRGFIRSHKGKNGGFAFDPYKPALELKEIVFFTEGDQAFQGCGLGLKQCSHENPCPLHKQFVPIRESILRLLSEETIQGLAGRLLVGEEMKIADLSVLTKSMADKVR
jgi:DNA-binding IscR family transcriptional regulator